MSGSLTPYVQDLHRRMREGRAKALEEWRNRPVVEAVEPDPPDNTSIDSPPAEGPGLEVDPQGWTGPSVGAPSSKPEAGLKVRGVGTEVDLAKPQGALPSAVVPTPRVEMPEPGPTDLRPLKVAQSASEELCPICGSREADARWTDGKPICSECKRELS